MSCIGPLPSIALSLSLVTRHSMSHLDAFLDLFPQWPPGLLCLCIQRRLLSSLLLPAVLAALWSAQSWPQLPSQNPSSIGLKRVILHYNMECTKLESESIQINRLDPPINSSISVHFVLLVLD